MEENNFVFIKYQQTTIVLYKYEKNSKTIRSTSRAEYRALKMLDISCFLSTKFSILKNLNIK